MRKAPFFCLVILSAGLAGCANIGLSIGLPIGGLGGVGVSVDTQGRVGGSVGVGRGGAGVSVGGSGQLPRSADDAASAAR